MPLHRIYHPPTAFSSTDKAGLAEQITNLYVSRGLPAFYVVVLFIPVEKDSFYVGGQTNDNFIRIVTQHLARQFPNSEAKTLFMEKFENILAPFIKEKGFDWEVHVEEVARETWRENGLLPPDKDTEAEKEWVRLNRPVPY